MSTSAASSLTAGAMNDVTSWPASRFMPGMRTMPPSGIAPMPYSIPFRRNLKMAGGKPM